jgi:hypothetical protein
MPESKRAFRNVKTGEIVPAKLAMGHVAPGNVDRYLPDIGGLPKNLNDWEAGWMSADGEFLAD